MAISIGNIGYSSSNNVSSISGSNTASNNAVSNNSLLSSLMSSSKTTLEKPSDRGSGIISKSSSELVNFLSDVNDKVKTAQDFVSNISNNINERNKSLGDTASVLQDSMRKIKDKVKPDAIHYVRNALKNIVSGEPKNILTGATALFAYADSKIQEKFGRGVVSTALNIFMNHDDAKKMATNFHSAAAVTAAAINSISSDEFQSKLNTSDTFSKVTMISAEVAKSMSHAAITNAGTDSFIYKIGDMTSSTAQRIYTSVRNVTGTVQDVNNQIEDIRSTVKNFAKTIEGVKNIYDTFSNHNFFNSTAKA